MSPSPSGIDYVGYQNNELVYVARGRAAARARDTDQGEVDADAPVRAEPDPLTSRLPRHVGSGARRHFDVLVLLPRAGDDPRSLRARHGAADAHPLLPDRRAGRGHPAGLLSGVPQVRRVDAACARRLQGHPRPQRDLARADAGHRRSLGSSTRSRLGSRGRTYCPLAMRASPSAASGPSAVELARPL